MSCSFQSSSACWPAFKLKVGWARVQAMEVNGFKRQLFVPHYIFPPEIFMCRRGQLYTFITYVSQSNTNTHIDRIHLSVTSSHITCVPLPNKEPNTHSCMGNITHPEETPGCGSESKWHYKSAGSPPTPTPAAAPQGAWGHIYSAGGYRLQLPSLSYIYPPPRLAFFPHVLTVLPLAPSPSFISPSTPSPLQTPSILVSLPASILLIKLLGSLSTVVVSVRWAIFIRPSLSSSPLNDFQ